MRVIELLIRYYLNVQRFFFKWIFAPASFVLFLLIVTPFGKFLNIQLDETTLLVLLIFFTTGYGAILLSAFTKSAESKTSALVPQETAITHAFAKIPKKGCDIRILIYTSYSIFKDFERKLEGYSGLRNSSIRILLRDPDVCALVPQGKYSITRRRQLNTALDSIARYQENNTNIEIRFYSNEPWTRGIQIGSSFLLYSTYANRKVVIRTEKEIEYSGTHTPWLEVQSDLSAGLNIQTEKARDFIKGFESLFDLVWEQCTRYKYLILDLDGTLFTDPKLSAYLNKQLPVQFIREKVSGVDKDKISQAQEIYAQNLKQGLASTASIFKAVEDATGQLPDLKEYIAWKDSKLKEFPIGIKTDDFLRQAIEQISKTYHLYLMTNHTSTFTDLALNKLGLSNHFPVDKRITIDETLCIKPDPRLRTILNERYGIDLRRSVFVGDRCKVDLSYVKNYCLGAILLEDTDALPKLLTSLKYPIEWVAEQSKTCEKYTFILKEKN